MSIYTSVEIISYSNTNDRLNPLDLHIRRNYKLFKLPERSIIVFYLHISRNYKLFKPNSTVALFDYLHISRNYKLFKLSIQNRKRGNLHISRNYKLFKRNMDKLDYEIYTSVEIISYSNIITAYYRTASTN